MKGKSKGPAQDKKSLIIGGFVVAVAAIVVIVAVFWPQMNASFGYTAVHLDNGEIYFGRASYFPTLTLRDVYTIQAVPDPESPDGTSLRIVPFNSAIWRPDKIRMNRDHIIFMGKVGEDSQVMQVIRNTQGN